MKIKWHLHKYKDVIEYDELGIKGSEVPFIAYEKCIKCDAKRGFVKGWIDITDVVKAVTKGENPK